VRYRGEGSGKKRNERKENSVNIEIDEVEEKGCVGSTSRTDEIRNAGGLEEED